MAAGVYKGLTIEIGATDKKLTTVLRNGENQARSLQRELQKVSKTKIEGAGAETFARKLSLVSSQCENAKKRLETLKAAESQIGKENMSTQQWSALQYDIAQCEAEVKKYESELQKLKNTQSGMGKLGSDLQAAGAKINDATEGLRTAGSTLTRNVSIPLAAAGAASIKAATTIDTALTSVKKTVDGTDEQYQQLKNSAIEYSKVQPVSADQLLSIESLGAQLGYSIDELDMFAKVVSGLDIATNMDAETAATELAQFANITNMAHSESKNYASTIVALGNNLATTESKISDMSMRVAAAGTQVGMSQAQILGWSGAMSSMGVEAEAGGTAFSNFVSEIDAAVVTGGDKLNSYAAVAGMSASDFANAWKSSSSETVMALLKGLSASDNMTVALESMGVTGIRQSDVLKRLAGNTDAVSKALNTANTGWEENIALDKEVENRNNSLAAKFETLKNNVIAVASEVGEPLANALLACLDAIKPLLNVIADAANAFANADKGTQQFIVGAVGAVAALGPLLSMAGRVGAGITTVGKAFSALSGFTSACSTKLGAVKAKFSANTIAANANAAATTKATAAANANAAANAKAASASNTAAAASTRQAAASTKAAQGIKTQAQATNTAAASTSKFAGATNILKSGLQNVIFTAALWAIEEIAVACANAQREMQLTNEASATLSDLQTDVANNVNTSSQSLGEQTSKITELKTQIEETNNAYRDNMSTVSSSAGQLDIYKGIINELANKDLPLTTAEQTKLEGAVNKYNSITGDSVEITDKERGALSKSTDAINENTEAWKRNAAKKAYQDLASSAVKDMVDAQQQLTGAYKELEDAQKALDDWQPTYNADGTADWYVGAELENRVKQAQKNIDDLTNSVSSSEKKFNDANAAADLMGRTIEQVAEAFTNAGEPAGAFEQLAQKLGTDTQSLTTKLNMAGISTEQLSQVGSAAFAALYQSAGGDMNKLKQQLDNIQNVTIDGKHFIVTDDGTIYNEDGQLADLQRVEIAGKHYFVTNDGHIYDETGQLQGLKNITIDGKHYTVSNDGTAWTAKEQTDEAKRSADSVQGTYTATVKADTSDAENGISKVLKGLRDLVSNAWTAIVNTVTGNAAGGIKQNAAGGLLNYHAAGGLQIRKHAKGYIANSPTVIDVAGEAGAEAIIPLTNRRYVTPFARAVAEQMNTAQKIDNSTTINVNNAEVNSRPEMEKAAYDLLFELRRYGYTQGAK